MNFIKIDKVLIRKDQVLRVELDDSDRDNLCLVVTLLNGVELEFEGPHVGSAFYAIERNG